MKNLLLLVTLLLTLSSCDKENDKPKSELEKLPPATQIGANKIGCLLDGKAFLPGNSPNSKECVYQFVNGGYNFSLQANNNENDGVLIGLSSNSKEITQNGIYRLTSNIPTNAYGSFALGGVFSTTDGNIYTGELKITKLDITNHIISGTFWFDVLDFQGNNHQITDGRFDMQYTN